MIKSGGMKWIVVLLLIFASASPVMAARGFFCLMLPHQVHVVYTTYDLTHLHGDNPGYWPPDHKTHTKALSPLRKAI